jgi:hypothetical protein
MSCLSSVDCLLPFALSTTAQHRRQIKEQLGVLWDVRAASVLLHAQGNATTNQLYDSGNISTSMLIHGPYMPSDISYSVRVVDQPAGVPQTWVTVPLLFTLPEGFKASVVVGDSAPAQAPAPAPAGDGGPVVAVAAVVRFSSTGVFNKRAGSLFFTVHATSKTTGTSVQVAGLDGVPAVFEVKANQCGGESCQHGGVCELQSSYGGVCDCTGTNHTRTVDDGRCTTVLQRTDGSNTKMEPRTQHIIGAVAALMVRCQPSPQP